MSILNDIRMAAKLESEKAKSDTLTKQFGKKAMQAQDQIDATSESLYGKKLADQMKEARKLQRKRIKEAEAQHASAAQQASAVPATA